MALYCAARQGGDFYDFLQIGKRLLVLVLDISGPRDQAFDIAATVQQRFRSQAAELFLDPVNESDTVTEMLLDLNRTILAAAGGVRFCPGFLGSYNTSLGTLSYINAGHLPALIREDGSIQELTAVGLPLGLFSHATHDTQVTVLQPKQAVLICTRGILEARNNSRVEFGLERLKEAYLAAKFDTAEQLAVHVLTTVQRFLFPDREVVAGCEATLPDAKGRQRLLQALGWKSGPQNDMTAVVLRRE